MRLTAIAAMLAAGIGLVAFVLRVVITGIVDVNDEWGLILQLTSDRLLLVPAWLQVVSATAALAAGPGLYRLVAAGWRDHTEMALAAYGVGLGIAMLGLVVDVAVISRLVPAYLEAGEAAQGALEDVGVAAAHARAVGQAVGSFLFAGVGVLFFSLAALWAHLLPRPLSWLGVAAGVLLGWIGLVGAIIAGPLGLTATPTQALIFMGDVGFVLYLLWLGGVGGWQWRQGGR